MITDSNPYWYKLIKLLKANGTISTGLTIPYIFGAYELLGQPFDTIKELIQHVYDSPINKYPVIQRCHVIGQHVIMVEKKETCHKHYKQDVCFKNPLHHTALYISSNSDLGKTFDTVCSNLTSFYAHPIGRRSFSWSNKEQQWKAFTPNEIDTITSI